MDFRWSFEISPLLFNIALDYSVESFRTNLVGRNDGGLLYDLKQKALTAGAVRFLNSPTHPVSYLLYHQAQIGPASMTDTVRGTSKEPSEPLASFEPSEPFPYTTWATLETCATCVTCIYLIFQFFLAKCRLSSYNKENIKNNYDMWDRYHIGSSLTNN